MLLFFGHLNFDQIAEERLSKGVTNALSLPLGLMARKKGPWLVDVQTWYLPLIISKDATLQLEGSRSRSGM
jgi:hypothetical protein